VYLDDASRPCFGNDPTHDIAAASAEALTLGPRAA
jgi:hypothetical protein